MMNCFYVGFDQNTILQRFECYHSPLMDKFVILHLNSKSQIHNYNMSSFDKFDFDGEKIEALEPKLQRNKLRSLRFFRTRKIRRNHTYW
jgi:hypothetical protein